MDKDGGWMVCGLIRETLAIRRKLPFGKNMIHMPFEYALSSSLEHQKIKGLLLGVTLH